MHTENGRETEDSFDFSRTLLNTFEQLSDAASRGANTTHTFCNKQFHDLCNFAETLDKNKHVYWIYGGPDGFVLAYSLLKYIPDLIYNGSKTETAQALRDFICNPWGCAATLTLLAASTITSAYANYMGKDKENPDSQMFYVRWQAFRDGAKGARNVNRGLRNTMDAMRLFSSIDMRYALLPLSLALGIPSMYNRWWNRHMVTIRKKSMDKNEALSQERLDWGRFDQSLTRLPASEEVLKKDHKNSYLLINKNNREKRRLYYVNRHGEAEDLKLTPEELNTFLEKKHRLPHHIDRKHPSLIQWQTILPKHADRHFKEFNHQVSLELNQNLDKKNTNHEHNNRFKCYLSAGFDGFTGGLYFFMGLISLITLSPEILTTVAIISVVCAVACIFTRLQEEREYDRLLRISEKKAVLISEVQTLQAQLATIAHQRERLHRNADDSFKRDTEEDEAAYQAYLRDETESDRTYAKIKDAYDALHAISSTSSTEAFFIGLKHGLTSHGTIVTGIFAASLINKVFFAAALPQAFVVGCVILSCAIILASIAVVISAAAQHREQQQTDAATQLRAVNDIIHNIKNSHDTHILTAIENETAFAKLCDGTPLKQWTFLSWLEVLRSTGSGIMKGPKSADFIVLTLFDASSHHDQENDHPWLSLTLKIALVIGAIIWAFRALAKYAKDLREKPGTRPGDNPGTTSSIAPTTEEAMAYDSGSDSDSSPDEQPSPLRRNEKQEEQEEYETYRDSPEHMQNLPPSTPNNRTASSNIKKAASYDSTLPQTESNSGFFTNRFNLFFTPRPASTFNFNHEDERTATPSPEHA
jgi:Na+-transporting NADH:ubiquinone oxidoreductase subunit NqrC